MTRPPNGWTEEFLDAATQRGDPVGHEVVQSLFDQGADRINQANRVLVNVPPNGTLPDLSGVSPDLRRSLEKYLTGTSSLPPWANIERCRRAEDFFFDHGILSILALFNASLPETYVVPTIAEVLQISGQLVDRAEYRIRTTARMIIPVMAHGGLTGPDGYGIGHVQRVRLIHATIRHLVLNGTKATGEFEATTVRRTPGSALGGAVMPHDVQEAMKAAGWDAKADGVPVNQVEMAYTLLTFSFISLRSLRDFGLRLSDTEEEDYLHCWNVVGHIIGLERELMADTMDEAAELFEAIRARGRKHPHHSRDPRPDLAAALIRVIERHIPLRVMKPLGALLTRKLIGDESANLLQIERHYSQATWVVFRILHTVLLASERVAQALRSHVSPIRFVSRVLGYHLFKGLLVDQTRPLQLPDSCLHPLLENWAEDPAHHSWVNWLERRFTGPRLITVATSRGG